MNTTKLKAQVSLIDDKVKMEALVPGKPPVIMDYFPPIGCGEGYTPLEILLMSLATCYGTTVKSMLTGHLKKEIRNLSLRVEGDRLAEHPTKFHTIRLSMNVDSPDLQMEELATVAAMAEDRYCPVWAMIDGNVTIKTELTIGEQLHERSKDQLIR